MSSWSDSVIWWQVYPLGFVGAEKQALPAGSPVRHRLPQLLGWLDYRFPEIDWRADHSNLVRLYDKLMLRPSFADTKP